MQVVLLEDVKSLGKKGEIVKVNDGYAHNFILPKKLGVEATPKNLNDLKLQDYYVQHGFDFIMLVTGLIHEKLNAAVRSMKKSSISTFDLLVKAGHMRMVMRENEWQLHNTRTKDLELLKAVGYIPEQSYPV